MKRRFVIKSLAVLILGINIAALAGLLFVPGEKDTGPVRKSVEVGEFRLSVTSAKSVYSVLDEMEFQLQIEYLGPEAQKDIYGSFFSTVIILEDGVSLNQKYGKKEAVGYPDIGRHIVLQPGEPYERFSNGSAYMSFVPFLSRKGEYTIKALFEFTPDDRHNLKETVRETLELEIEIR